MEDFSPMRKTSYIERDKDTRPLIVARHRRLHEEGLRCSVPCRAYVERDGSVDVLVIRALVSDGVID